MIFGHIIPHQWALAMLFGAVAGSRRRSSGATAGQPVGGLLLTITKAS